MFAVDDEIESSPKHETLDALPPARRARAFEAWLRLGAAARKRGTGGLVTLALAEKILHRWRPAERLETLADLVAARGGRENGLLIVEGDAWRFHEWERWNPDEEEAAAERDSRSASAERSRRYRARKKTGATPDDTPKSSRSERDASRDDDRDAERDGVTPRALRAPATRVRDPVPSHPVPSQDQPGSLGERQDPSVSPLGRLIRGFQSRWEAKRDARGMALGAGWPGFGPHRGLADDVAARYADKPEQLAESLDAYFASTDPFVVSKARWNFATWARDPGKWAAANGYRAPSTTHTPTSDAELDAVFGPEEDP